MLKSKSKVEKKPKQQKQTNKVDKKNKSKIKVA